MGHCPNCEVAGLQRVDLRCLFWYVMGSIHFIVSEPILERQGRSGDLFHSTRLKSFIGYHVTSYSSLPLS